MFAKAPASRPAVPAKKAAARKSAKKDVPAPPQPQIPSLALSTALIFADPERDVLLDLPKVSDRWKESIVLSTPFWVNPAKAPSEVRKLSHVSLTEGVSDLVAASIQFDPDRPLMCYAWSEDDVKNATAATWKTLSACRNVHASNVHASASLDSLALLAKKLPSLVGIEVNVDEGMNIDAVKNFKYLRSLRVKSCGPGIDLSDLGKLTTLRTLEIKGCEEHNDVSFLASMKSMEVLILRDMAITDVDFIRSMPNLLHLNLHGCIPVSDISALEATPLLRRLDLGQCYYVSDLTDLAGLTSLEWLCLDEAEGLESLDGIEALSSLQYLYLRDTRLQSLSGLASLPALRLLDVRYCHSLTDISALGSVLPLEYLSLNGCKEISDVSALEHLTSLEHLDLHWCNKVTKLDSLKPLKSLKWLRLSNGGFFEYRDITDISPLSGLTSLEHLDLSGCGKLTKVAPLASLKYLKTLELRQCTKVRDVKSLPATVEVRL